MEKQHFKFDIDASNFYQVASIISNLTPEYDEKIKALYMKALSTTERMGDLTKSILNSVTDLTRDSRMNIDIPDGMISRKVGEDHTNYVVFVYQICEVIRAVASFTEDAVRDAKRPILVMGDKKDANDLNSMQHMLLEMQVNSSPMSRFSSAILRLTNREDILSDTKKEIVKLFERYHRQLVHRHHSEGFPIFVDPVTTDLAITIFDNVDKHGDIEDTGELSGYSKMKAQQLTEALNNDTLKTFMSGSETISKFCNEALDTIESILEETAALAGADTTSAMKTLTNMLPESLRATKNEYPFEANIRDLDPSNIKHRQSDKILSNAEKFAAEITQETIKGIAEMLHAQAPMSRVIEYVVQRKTELRDYFRDENSFYVCVMGGRGMFSTPGELKVVPGERPTVNFADVLGDGFDDMRLFHENILDNDRWSEIMKYTAPGGKADRGNVLLIGPQGCGKTEVLRAVGADKNTIGIFASGSDFLTCWAGEAEKNPKRLFEAALKLSRESKGRRVFILLDEVDAVLAEKPNSSIGNLALEFQQLMDGLVHYPKISVWATTNHLDKIPMPMIRRFHKTAIVGELNTSHRQELFQKFTSHMPMPELSQSEWDYVCEQLDGATGDVVRKAADALWRKFIRSLVRSEDAAQMAQDFVLANDHELVMKSLRSFKTISFKEVARAVEETVNNVGIRKEIETAVATYDAARDILSGRVSN